MRDDLLRGRPSLASRGLEELNWVARGVVNENLLPTRATNDLVAKRKAGLAQALHLFRA